MDTSPQHKRDISLKTYKIIRISATIILAIIVSQSILLGSFLIPVASVAIFSIALLLVRKRVKGIVADERDYEVGGSAARWAIQIYAWIVIVAIFALFALRFTNPFFEPIAVVLAYSVCLLMILYALIFRFYHRVRSLGSRWWFGVVVAILLGLLVVASIRGLSGEDGWICNEGSWVAHGSPSGPVPSVACPQP